MNDFPLGVNERNSLAGNRPQEAGMTKRRVSKQLPAFWDRWRNLGRNRHANHGCDFRLFCIRTAFNMRRNA
jgi:hypothetical protein